MRRRCAATAFALAFALTSGLIWSAAAQGACCGIGQPVPYVDPDGVQHGTLTVKDMADPFTEYDPAHPPDAGSRYVLLTVDLKAAADQSMEVDPNSVLLQDTDGYLWGRQDVRRPKGAKIPDLKRATLAPGDHLSGVLGYVVPESAAIDRILYQPDSGRLIELADLLANAGPSVGASVPLTDAKGGSATVTTAIADPFTDYAPDHPPDAGSRFIVATLVYENVGEQAFRVDPHAILLRDSEGYLWGGQDVRRPADPVIPDLTGVTLAPGDQISGVVGFIVPAAAHLEELDLQPDGGRLVLLADLTSGTKAQASAEPSPASP